MSRRPTTPFGRMVRCLIGVISLLLSTGSIALVADDPLTLEKIMADPDWIGAPARNAFWSVDGKAIYYSIKHAGSPVSDLHRIDLTDHQDCTVEGTELGKADRRATYDPTGKRAAFIRNGDVFVRELQNGRLQQISRGIGQAVNLQFSADGHLLSFRLSDDEWILHDFATGLTAPAATLRAEADPDSSPASDDLRESQMRTFSSLKQQRDDRDVLRHHDAAQRKEDPARSAAPYFLGDDVVIRATSLSPDAHWMLVITSPKSADPGRRGDLLHYVTESGYEEIEKEPTRVGRNPPSSQAIKLIDLSDHSIHALSVETLPGINDDPLRSIRELNARVRQKKTPDIQPGSRGIWVVSEDPDDTIAVSSMVWSRDAKQLAIQIFSRDFKDRWIASVDLNKYALVSQHRLTDAAWVNSGAFNEMGWLNDNVTLWYESEESGFGHLYTKKLTRSPVALTRGRFEVSGAVPSPDGRWFYLIANAEASHSYDVYRVAARGGELQRISRLQGVEEFALDRRGERLLITHSSSYAPAQLSVAASNGSGTTRQLTDTRTPAYSSIHWITPERVPIPSTHFSGDVPAKLYRPAAAGSGTQPSRPAILFLHGAGYRQDVSHRFSAYFREEMFNNLLAQHGYVVLVPDYRASAGYGREWRTAIYRQMGHPELEDLLDGKRWLVAHAGVDPKRVGLYGGSYGGFLTLMALFRAPGEFAAGAALRPVSNWRLYEHLYTAQILNDPAIDPIAYETSSPIEFASGLRDSLLICHGVVDEHVSFQDSMALYQRLIELHKDDFAISPYPQDRHTFAHADSWLDEYKRIYRLFESRLNSVARQSDVAGH